METPARRCAPPPPSAPPPAHISRSGRVPLPKGAPPGDARRARQPGRGRLLSPSSLDPKLGTRGEGRQEGSQDAERWTAEDASGRNGDRRRDRRSDEGITNSDSSEEVLGNEANDATKRDEHPLPMVSKRRTSYSPGSRIPRREMPSRNSGSSASRSPRDRRPSGEGGPKVENRRRGRGKGRELRSSRSSWSSRDDSPDNKEDIKGRRARECDREGGQLESWGRKSTPEPRRDARHSYDGDRRRWRHSMASDPDSEGEGGQLFCRSQNNKQHSHIERRSLRGDIEDGKGKDGGGHWRSHSSTDESGDSDMNSTNNMQSRSQRKERRPRSRSKSDVRFSGKSGRRKRRGVDTEAEEVGGIGNKYDAEEIDTATGEIIPEHTNSPVFARKGDNKALHQEMDPDNGATYVGDALLNAQRRSTRSTDRGKELHGSDVRENSRERTLSGHGVSPAGSGHSVTDRAVTSQPPRNQNTSASSPPGNLYGTSTRVTFGKPIRGARWGEAIGVRSKVFDTTTIPTARGDLKSFVTSPLRSGPGTVLRCFIERKRGGTHKFSNMFSMYADLEDGSGRLLLAARKLLASKTAYYIICIRQDDLFRDNGKRGGTSFLGKLRASTPAHTEYALYDRGENPASIATKQTDESGSDAEAKTQNPAQMARVNRARRDKQDGSELRKELGVIIYNFDKKEQRTGKRRMEVTIPQLHQQDNIWEPVSWQPSETKEGMKPSFGRIRYQGAQNLLQDDRLLVFHQRESRYDPLSSCLVDFRGRATAPSVKNFQLIQSPPEDNVKRVRYYSEGAGKDDCESDDVPRPVFLQMGKVGKDCFNVDVEWPLSLLQAFAICLSRFDTNAHF